MIKHSQFFLLCLAIIFVFEGCSQTNVNSVCFQKSCLEVEVVESPEDLRRGLQHRQILESMTGMLFIFQNNRRHSFWMKDTLVALDMIWMDYSRKIVFIEHNVPPCSSDPCPVYAPPQNALYVLEINGGEASRLKLKEGLVANFELNGSWRK